MNDYFIWNNTRCTDYGIHVLTQPPITIPLERSEQTVVPGRAGSLTTLEGEDVYDDLLLTAECYLADPARIPDISAWLKGKGTVTFANGKQIIPSVCPARPSPILTRPLPAVRCSSSTWTTT